MTSPRFFLYFHIYSSIIIFTCPFLNYLYSPFVSRTVEYKVWPACKWPHCVDVWNGENNLNILLSEVKGRLLCLLVFIDGKLVRRRLYLLGVLLYLLSNFYNRGIWLKCRGFVCLAFIFTGTCSSAIVCVHGEFLFLLEDFNVKNLLECYKRLIDCL